VSKSKFKSALENPEFFRMVDENLQKLPENASKEQRIAAIQEACDEICDKLGLPKVEIISLELEPGTFARYNNENNTLYIQESALNDSLTEKLATKLGAFVIHELVHVEQANLVARYEAEKGGKSLLKSPLDSKITDSAKVWLANGGCLSEEEKERVVFILKDYTRAGLNQRAIIEQEIKDAEADFFEASKKYDYLRGVSSRGDDKDELDKLRNLRLSTGEKYFAALDKYRDIGVESEAYQTQGAYEKYMRSPEKINKSVSQQLTGETNQKTKAPGKFEATVVREKIDSTRINRTIKEGQDKIQEIKNNIVDQNAKSSDSAKVIQKETQYSL
jgi:hypothetical protein